MNFIELLLIYYAYKVDINGRGPVPILSLIMSYRHTYVGHLHRFFYRSMVQMYFVQGHELRKLPLLKVMEVSQSLSSQNHRSYATSLCSSSSNQSIDTEAMFYRGAKNSEKAYIKKNTKHKFHIAIFIS